jgi:hypothetical protein
MADIVDSKGSSRCRRGTGAHVLTVVSSWMAGSFEYGSLVIVQKYLACVQLPDKSADPVRADCASDPIPAEQKRSELVPARGKLGAATHRRDGSDLLTIFGFL